MHQGNVYPTEEGEEVEGGGRGAPESLCYSAFSPNKSAVKGVFVEKPKNSQRLEGQRAFMPSILGGWLAGWLAASASCFTHRPV